MLSFNDFISSGISQTFEMLLDKQNEPPLTNNVNSEYNFYQMAYAMIKGYTLADDELLDKDIAISLGVVVPVMANLYHNSFYGTSSESTSNDGITKSRTYQNDILEPYKQYLHTYRKIKLL